MTGLIAKRYRIESPLQHGGSVFQAFDLQLARTVALKMLPGERLQDGTVVEQFFEEATAAARLGHENVVRVYDVTEHYGRPHLRNTAGRDPVVVMEYVPGQDLDYFIRGREPLPSEELTEQFERRVGLVMQICRGLHHGHEQGLVHGALTPSNIRVTVSGEAKILNFGITPVTGGPSSLFTSPEQCTGESGIDRRSDIFSLGMVLYELFASEHQVDKDLEASGLEELATDCPPAVLRIVQQAAAADPADRFADCHAMERALRELISVFPLQMGVGIPAPLPVIQHASDDPARRQAETLLKEAREAQATGQPAVASLLAFQALQLDPDLGDAARLFEQTQDVLKGRREAAPEQAAERPTEASSPYPVVNAPESPAPWFTPPGRTGRSGHGLRSFFKSRLVRLALPIAAVVLLLILGAWFAKLQNRTGPAPVAAGEGTPAPEQSAPASGTVSLDVVPWSRVESIVRVNDGRAMELGPLETPCVITLPPGRYLVVVSHPDFGSRQFSIDVRSGELETVEHSLLSKQELEREMLSAPVR